MTANTPRESAPIRVPHGSHRLTTWETRMPVLRAREEVGNNTSAWVNIRTMPAWAGVVASALRPHHFGAFSEGDL